MKRLFRGWIIPLVAICAVFGVTACDFHNADGGNGDLPVEEGGGENNENGPEDGVETEKTASYYFLDSKATDYTYSGMKEIEEVEGFSVGTNAAPLMLFYKTDASTLLSTYKVYNYMTDEVVMEFADSADVEYSITFVSLTTTAKQAVCVHVQETSQNGSTVTVYTESGEEIGRGAQHEVVIYGRVNLIAIRDTYYCVDGQGGFSTAFQKTGANELVGSFQCASEKYYYNFQQGMPWFPRGDENLKVYDRDGDLVLSYPIPLLENGERAIPQLGLLKNGNIIIQYSELLGSDEYMGEYDYAIGDNKYDITTTIIEAESGAEKTIECNVQIEWARYDEYMFSYSGLNPKLNTVMYGRKIVETEHGSELDTSERGYYEITDEGEIIPFKEPFSSPNILRYYNQHYFTSEQGKIVIYNEKGELIGSVEAGQYLTEKYIVNYRLSYDDEFNVVPEETESKVYDYELNEVFDLAEGGYTCIDYVGESLILSDGNGAIYLYNETLSEIGRNIEISVGSGKQFYYTTQQNSESLYYFYNRLGEEIGNVNHPLSFWFGDGTGKVVMFGNDGTFYRLVY